MIYAILAIVVIYIVRSYLTSRADISGENLRECLAQGGKLIDVRSPGEFRSGHPRGAVNIPLDRLPAGLDSQGVSKDTTIVLCCASGIRSGKAKRILRRSGYKAVYNGGSVGSL